MSFDQPDIEQESDNWKLSDDEYAVQITADQKAEELKT